MPDPTMPLFHYPADNMFNFTLCGHDDEGKTMDISRDDFPELTNFKEQVTCRDCLKLLEISSEVNHA